MNCHFRFLFFAYLVLVSAFHADPAEAGVLLQGGGATFPYPLYAKWFAAFSEMDKGVDFNYQRVGSGEGQRLITNQFIDFGASDAPMSSEALANAPGKILHIPTVGGADVIIFNLHNVKELQLDGPTLAAIYLGKITQWKDPAITRQNPGIKLPDEQITVVHRSDGSGTSYIFTDYLHTVSSEWQLKVGRYLSVNWPTGVGLSGSDAVAAYVKNTPGAIGFVELLYAIQNELGYASIQNAAGNYIKASPDSITAALASAVIPDDFRISMVNAPGADSYPIAGVTWILVYEHPQDAVKAKELVAFLTWAETEGQKMARELNFAPLPESVQSRVLTEIKSISAGG
ncbi:MAG: phosphate ABC transporter substrate-binding protein PstS [Verrucomicrobia bacterium]|nr:phosphate ABC transporter substrate-binding protein PstS [Verrucomicrobiota bacterium]MBV8275131.1 phosphate ABC transporter substrate-binding protein PstS [Verrucomicrobiota bacterium]